MRRFETMKLDPGGFSSIRRPTPTKRRIAYSAAACRALGQEKSVNPRLSVYARAFREPHATGAALTTRTASGAGFRRVAAVAASQRCGGVSIRLPSEDIWLEECEIPAHALDDDLVSKVSSTEQRRWLPRTRSTLSDRPPRLRHYLLPTHFLFPLSAGRRSFRSASSENGF